MSSSLLKKGIRKNNNNKTSIFPFCFSVSPRYYLSRETVSSPCRKSRDPYCPFLLFIPGSDLINTIDRLISKNWFLSPPPLYFVQCDRPEGRLRRPRVSERLVQSGPHQTEFSSFYLFVCLFLGFRDHSTYH